MAPKAKRRRGTVVDFTDVKAGGLSIPDGRYKAKIIDWEEKEGNDSGEAYIQLEWEITSDKCNGRSIKFDNHSLQVQALPFLRTVLEALEYEIEESPDFEIDWDGLIKDETECIIETVAVPSRDDPSKKFARITGFYPLSDGNTVDDEEDEKPKAEKKKPVKDDSDDEDDTPPKRGSKEPSKDEEEAEDDEDDEDDTPPKKPGKIKKGAKVKFKDEKNKLTKGTIESIDGGTATVTTDDGDYEIDLEELTVIG